MTPTPPAMSLQRVATERENKAWELFISCFAEMFIGKQRGKVEWFDLISKSNVLAARQKTILQLVVISCADDLGGSAGCGRCCFLVPG